MLPIAEDDLGNLYLLSLRNKDYGKIYFWDHELESETLEAPTENNLTILGYSFTKFIKGLKKFEFDIEPEVISVWSKPGTEDLFKDYEIKKK